ncbi:hypothetical protein DICPUDRAFT_152618 [Dictyostelium purpureum]|uniref:Nuclear pore complex protein Nup85 n=1 Tax=Dictyostelium purpureum TaxID=5786 RepID=F0ZLV0_DICPU|nr:uncharacterized protein DICPUDRAFT_152618 [Dictyostelium purpureum]EGC35092.1 hypothetical protein DICPUDRAFT_152618 [Dictyostelium purpureum]|eukprot:XP_003288399.1 hypothetical protein DICPUDRAFT_152618 [Dictyostelium purpureum]
MFSFSKQNDGNNGFNTNIFPNITVSPFNTVNNTFETTPMEITTTSSSTNSSNNKTSKSSKFCNFKWSPTGDQLLLFKPNIKGSKIKYQVNNTLSSTRKFLNDLYTHFESTQRIANSQVVPDDRLREISHLSKTYLSVILSTISQMVKACKTGSYIDNEDSYINCDPNDKELMDINRERVENILKSGSSNTLVVFCGSSDSIYPLLCSQISNKLKPKCILIARETNQPTQQKQDIINTIKRQTEIRILSKEEYSNRYNYIAENFGNQDSIESADVDDVYFKYIEEIEFLYLASTVWKVASLFYFNISSSMISPNQLLDCIDNERKELMDTYEGIMNKRIETSDPVCFDHMAKLLVCGCIDQVISILGLMSKAPRSASQITSTARKSPINLLVDILTQIPLKKKQSNFNPNETLLQWKKWSTDSKRQLTQYIDSGSSSKNQIDENLLPIIKILLGDQETIRYYCKNSFLQLVISNLLYVEYVTSTSALRSLFTQCYEIIQEPSEIEKIFLSFATKEINYPLKTISKYFPTWLSTHLSDLLYHHPYFMRKSPSEPSELTKVREHLLSEHGQSLASDPALLQVGCNYLKYVENGQFMIDEFISRQPIQYEKNALKMIDNWVTSQETKNSIYKMLSVKDFQRQRYASALSWLILTNDSSRITQLSNYLLENQLNSDFLNDLQSILEKNLQINTNRDNNNNNGSEASTFDISSNNELIFLIKYRELINLWKERSFKEYSSLLCQMFKDKIIPKNFWLRLLLDCIPLFESNKNVYFNYQDTLFLQTCLEEIIQSHLFDQYSQSISNQDIQILRVSLARNLAKSIMVSTSTNNLSLF